jgi:hypothetical protein
MEGAEKFFFEEADISEKKETSQFFERHIDDAEMIS